jgi:succinate-semialdehyde dehydrogenase/glutarate-semialdehyde dehydrogenase
VAIESRNPATGELLEAFEATPPAEVERVLARAAGAFDDWRRRRFAERAGVLREAARRLRVEKAEHAQTMALEMGKPVAQGEEEIEKCAWACEFFAEHGEAFMAEEPRKTDASRSYVRFDPLGAVLAVMPWNFPFWQVFRFAAPALMAGNVGVLKHASNVPRCALGHPGAAAGGGRPGGRLPDRARRAGRGLGDSSPTAGWWP